MREIKFRAWDKYKNKMFDECVGDRKDKKAVSLNSFFRVAESEGLILMQYTGLKDKEGKEIYEGDILQTPMRIRGKIKIETNVVVWECGAFYLGVDLEYLLSDYSEDMVEVIGNIYKNPELFKEGEHKWMTQQVIVQRIITTNIIGGVLR